MVHAEPIDMSKSGVNSEWQHFLQEKVNSFIKWDLARFFHDNPHTAETAQNIAKYVGRDARVVVSELNGLVKSGILTAEKHATTTIFRLSSDPSIRTVLDEFMVACANRDFRVKAIQYVIMNMDDIA